MKSEQPHKQTNKKINQVNENDIQPKLIIMVIIDWRLIEKQQ